MLNERLFKFWHDLPEALRTGRPQNEVKHGQKQIRICGAFPSIAAGPDHHGHDSPRLEFGEEAAPHPRGLIDDARRENVFGLLDYTGADFRKWSEEVGFKRFEVIHLADASSAAIAYK